ncbi:uncharacterized protein LOC128249248 [Octopus bimaculoides]|uniref:uncharacterized protein LOC128249248 n=1 Tax=Octopus bimaculoides TaxID=37653 RepID=UPI0022E879B5|nr:uncharacterized protein LOC128249248 [Octopus bimaculoides]
MNTPPSDEEYQIALNRMKHRKSPRPDNIPMELLKHGRLLLNISLFTLIFRMWKNRHVPEYLKDVVITTIFKKGDRKICGNFRGISLLSTEGKIFARLHLDRLAELKSRRLTRERKITELPYADDNAAVCHSCEQLQKSVNSFTNAYTKSQHQKTKSLAQLVLSQETPDFNITISETSLEKVDHFSYLGSLLPNKCISGNVVENRFRATHTSYAKNKS